ncbi:MAG: T9SS type A sorting domain-containing protein [Bacteroidales bacterium]|jgi:hypothetical protein|nr:T9SS type A sorting domain-containing protein [Bacteroidales bacterium]
MKNYIFIILILISLSSQAQSSFELLIKTNKHEVAADVFELDNGDYIICGYNRTPDQNDYNGLLFKISSDGKVLKKKEYFFTDSISMITNLLKIQYERLICFGSKGLLSTSNLNKIWYNEIDTGLNEITSRIYSLDSNYLGVSYNTLVDNNKIILGGLAYNSLTGTDIFIYSLTTNGDSLNSTFLQMPYYQVGFWLSKYPDKSEYQVCFFGNMPPAPANYPGKIATFDSLLNFIQVDTIPRFLNQHNTLKWLNNNEYILTGKKHFSSPSRRVLGILKIDTNNNVINETYLGMEPDTINYPGSGRNMDFIESNNIYYGGVANIIPEHYPWQAEPTWIMLNNLDSNLNINWQSFYGGDAFYYLWGLRATQDGGCIMLCTRYDHNTQYHEYDIYILKVDSLGLITNINENTKINISNAIVYPNPGKNQITIKTFTKNSYFELFDITGKILLKKFIPDYSTEVNVSHLPKGMYFYRIYNNKNIFETGKWVKQ